MLFWFIWGLAGILWELFAIFTKEEKRLGNMQIITLSRTIWRTFKFEDRSYDKNEKKIRIIFSIVYCLLFGWLMYHLGWGPCAGGICSE